MPVGGGVVQAARETAQFGGEDHADGDGGAVPPVVALVLLDGVREGVPVVEDLAQAGFLEVAGDDLGLDPDGALDQLGGVRTAGDAAPGRVLLDQLQDGRVGDESGLDDLGETADVVVDRQRVQRGQVAQHPGRGVEGADEVLALGGVDAGLAADRRVDHAEHGRRDGDPAHPAQPGRGDEPGEVGGGAAADADDDITAGEAGLAERLPAVRGDLGGLGLFRVGQLDGDGLVPLVGEVLADRLTGVGQRLGVQDGDALGACPIRPGSSPRSCRPTRTSYGAVPAVPPTWIRVTAAPS